MHVEPNWGLKSFQIQALLWFYTQMDSNMTDGNRIIFLFLIYIYFFTDLSDLTTLELNIIKL